jgi:threonine dehydratase
VEGAGAVGIAALLAKKIDLRGPAVALVSGRNIDEARHQQIVNADNAAKSAGVRGR